MESIASDIQDLKTKISKLKNQKHVSQKHVAKLKRSLSSLYSHVKQKVSKSRQPSRKRRQSRRSKVRKVSKRKRSKSAAKHEHHDSSSKHKNLVIYLPGEASAEEQLSSQRFRKALLAV